MLIHTEQAGTLPTRHPLADVHNDAHLIEMWLTVRKSKSAESLRAYKKDIEEFFVFTQSKAIASISYNDLQDYYRKLETQGYVPKGKDPSQKKMYSCATVNRKMSCVKSLISYGFTLGYLSFNVGKVITLVEPKNTLAERILTIAQVKNIINLEPNPRNRLILHFLYSSGGRVSEVCNILWRDLKEVGDRGQVTFYGKGNKTRVVPVSKLVWDALQAMKPSNVKPNDGVFLSRNTKAGNVSIRPNQVRKIVTKAGDRAGIPNVSCHYFRHSHASHALDNGASLHLVKESLGHSSIAITERYLHAKPNDGSSLYLPFYSDLAPNRTNP